MLEAQFVVYWLGKGWGTGEVSRAYGVTKCTIVRALDKVAAECLRREGEWE